MANEKPLLNKPKRLWLGLFCLPPGYSSGTIQIGLYEARTEEEAKQKMAGSMEHYGEDALKYARIKMTPLNGQPIEIMSLPTDYVD